MCKLMDGRGEKGEVHGDTAMVVVYLGFAELHGAPWLSSREQWLLVHRGSTEGGQVV